MKLLKIFACNFHLVCDFYVCLILVSLQHIKFIKEVVFQIIILCYSFQRVLSLDFKIFEAFVLRK